MRTLLIFSLLTASPAAWAQSATSTSTTSTSRTQTLRTTNVAAEVNNYLTRITARFGSGPLLYDQSFNVQLSDPTVQAAIQQARNQLTGAVSISGPTQVSNVRSLTGTRTSTVVNNSVNTLSVQTVFAIGPGTQLTGDLGLCTGPAVADQVPSGCPGGTPFVVVAGSTNVNINTNTQSDIFQTVTTTSTFLTSQTYELNGTAAPSPPATPAPPSLWLAICGIAASGVYYMKRNRNPDGA